jgi:hypothetical protein
MIHTYEVFVDIRESLETNPLYHNETARYEIDAESQQQASGVAFTHARDTHPQWVECDVRVTRLLK